MTETELRLETEQTDDGTVQFHVSLHNLTDEPIEFQTYDSALFEIDAVADGRALRGVGDRLAIQTVTGRVLEPDEPIRQTSTWKSMSAWESMATDLSHFDADPEEMAVDFPEDYDEVTVTVRQDDLDVETQETVVLGDG